MEDDKIEEELKVIMDQPTFENRLEVAADHLLTRFDVDDTTQRLIIKGYLLPVIHQLT